LPAVKGNPTPLTDVAITRVVQSLASRRSAADQSGVTETWPVDGLMALAVTSPVQPRGL
jgi:hypothetical protein